MCCLRCWLTWWNCFMAAWNSIFEKRFSKWLMLQDSGRLRWNESTHYVRVIAVFKISLTLCVSICRAFGQIGEEGSQKKKKREGGRRGGEDWLVVIYKHCVLWLPFSQAETQEDAAGYTLGFFTPAFSLRFFFCMYTQTHTHSKPASTHPPFSVSHSETHTHPNSCIHTPRLSLATELPLQWDHRFKNKAVGS